MADELSRRGIGMTSQRTRERLQGLTEGGDLTVSRLTVAAGLMADLTEA